MRHNAVSPLIVAAGILVLFVVSPQSSAQTHIYVDGSDSMRGFYDAGGLEAVVESVSRAARSQGGAVETSVFVTTDGETRFFDWPAWEDSRVWGTETRLDAALERARGQSALAVLVTDNFHDPENTGSSADSTLEFYSQLRTSDIARAWMIPDLLQFSGRVYLPLQGLPASAAEVQTLLRGSTPKHFWDGTGVPDEGIGPVQRGNTVWRADFRGLKALALYVLAFKEGTRADAASLVSEHLDDMGDHAGGALLVRPIGRDAIEAVVPHAQGPSDNAMLCADSDLPKNLEVNLTLERHGPDARLVPGSGYSYDPLLPTRLVAAVAFSSSESHVQVKQLPSDCAATARVHVDGFQLKIPASFARAVEMPPVNTSAVPPVILGDPSAGATADGTVLVVVDLPPLVGNVPSELLDGCKIEAAFNITVSIPGSSLGLSDRITESFFTQSVLNLGPVYSPKDLLSYLATERVEVSIPVEVSAEVFSEGERSFDGRALLALLLALFLVLLLAAVAWWVFRPLGMQVDLVLEDSSGKMTSYAFPVGGIGPAAEVEVRDPEVNVAGVVVYKVRKIAPWKHAVEIRTTGQPKGAGTALAIGDEVTMPTGTVVRRVKRGA